MNIVKVLIPSESLNYNYTLRYNINELTDDEITKLVEIKMTRNRGPKSNNDGSHYITIEESFFYSLIRNAGLNDSNMNSESFAREVFHILLDYELRKFV